MKGRVILITALIVTIIVGPFVYRKVDRYLQQRPAKNADELRSTIVASIKNPFPQADMVILKTKWKICGNTDPDDRPIIFSMHLDRGKYKYLLDKQLQEPILTTPELYTVMERACLANANSPHYEDWWGTFKIGKIDAEILAEQLSPRHVLLYESYSYADTVKFIKKDFVFNDDKWAFLVVDNNTKILSTR